MKFKTSNTKFYSKEGKFYILMQVPDTSANEANKLCEVDAIKTIEFKKEGNSRSLNANAYAWTIINKMAKAVDSTDEEIYHDMLHKYGTKEYIACLPNIIPELKKVFKIVEVVNETNLNGKKGVTLRLIRGSSSYDTAEMSKLIEGLVGEAKILNIETLSPNELARMMEGYKQ